MKIKKMDNMKNEERVIPDEMREKWQRMLDDLAEQAEIPCAAITRLALPKIENLLISDSPGNPATAGHIGTLTGSYCEYVIKTDAELLVPDALADPDWESNPDVKLNLIAYCGLPLHYADGSSFGTICVLDSKENRFEGKVNDLLVAYQQGVQKDLNEI